MTADNASTDPTLRVECAACGRRIPCRHCEEHPDLDIIRQRVAAMDDYLARATDRDDFGTPLGDMFADLLDEVERLRDGIRQHRDAVGSYTEDDEALWALLDDREERDGV